MIVLGLILALVGSLVPGLDSRAKTAFIVTGVVLVVLGAILLVTGSGSYNWPFYRPLP